VDLLDRLLKRKRVGAKNPVFVEAGRRGGIRSGEVRRARAERRRSLEVEASPTAATDASDTIRESFTGDPTELAEKVSVLLEAPMEPGSLEPIEPTASPASMEPLSGEEMEEEGGAPEVSVLSSLERALEEAELSDITSVLPSPQHIEKAKEELEDIKYMFEIPYTMSILEKLSNRGAGEAKTPEAIELDIKASKEEVGRLDEEVRRILR